MRSTEERLFFPFYLGDHTKGLWGSWGLPFKGHVVLTKATEICACMSGGPRVSTQVSVTAFWASVFQKDGLQKVTIQRMRKFRKGYQKENIWVELSVKKSGIKSKEHKGKPLRIFKLVVEGEAVIRSWRWISGEHIKWNFLFLKCEYTKIPLKHSSCQIFSSSPAQRAKTASNARFTCLTPTFPMATRDAGKQEVQHREDGAFPMLAHKTDHSLQSCCHNNHKKGP